MKEIFLIGIELLGVALTLTGVGVILVWNKSIRRRNIGRYALLAAALTTAVGVFAMQRAKQTLGLQDVDILVYSALVITLTYIIFWVCVDRVLEGHTHSADFQNSSVLSMLYTHSMQEEMDFPPTEILSR